MRRSTVGGIHAGTLWSGHHPVCDCTLHPMTVTNVGAVTRSFDARRCRRAVHRTVAAAALLVLSATSLQELHAQSLLERTTNLSGGWVGPAGLVHFHFVHRFNQSGRPARQVQNRPTFLAAYTTPWELLAGVHYATRSALVAGVPNEWEVFLRGRPLRQPLGIPAEVGAQVGYNAAARSLDSELSAARDLGPLRGLLAVRWLTRDARTERAAGALAIGGLGRLHEHVAIGADVGRRWVRGEDADESRLAWGAGVHVRLPGTPHTLALQMTNTDATTLHAASRGHDIIRWGFEFTVPLTTARYVPGRTPLATAAAAVATDTVVRVALHNLAFQPATLRIKAGTTVEWHNRDPLEHTVTAEDGSWDSGPIEPDAVWRNRFPRAGRYVIVCTPHPFMRAEVIVE